MRQGLKLPLLLVLSLLCLADAVVAQDLDNVTISGLVMDQNGAVIPGASVTAVLIKTKAGRTVTTDEDGRYKIIQLEPGIYSVKASFTVKTRGVNLYDRDEAVIM